MRICLFVLGCIAIRISTLFEATVSPADMKGGGSFLLFLGVVCVALAGGFITFFSARSIGKDLERGNGRSQNELDAGIHLVVRDDKRLVILTKNILLPGEGETFYRLDDPLQDDVFAIQVTRDRGDVFIEPYRGSEASVPA